MHAVRPVDIGRVDLKVISFLMAHLLMLVHAGFVMSDYLAIKEDDRLINVDDMDFPLLVVIPLYIAAISILFVMVVLLVYKPNMENHRVAMDLTFALLISTVSAAYNLVWEYAKPTATVHRVLIFVINAVLLYMTRCYWKKLNAHIQLEHD